MHVEGRETKPILLYALSTCAWCKRVKALLDEMGVAYDYLYVNELDETEKDAVRAEVLKWNPRCSLPTMVIDEKECVVGFQEDRIRELVQS